MTLKALVPDHALLQPEARHLHREADELKLPTLRMIKADCVALLGQGSDFKGSWKTATEKSARTFSAVAGGVYP